MAGAAPQHFWMIRVGVLNYVVPVMSGPEEGTEMPSDEGASDSSDALTRDVSATDAGEAVTEALSDAARQAVMSPKVRAAVLAAVQGKTTGPLGLESPAISRAVNTALADAATQAVMNPDVQRSIREAVRTTTLGLPGLQTPAITRAVNTAFADAAKQAVLSPQVNQAFRDAVRTTALGLPGLQTPAITRAVNTAFADAAKQAVLSPQVNQAFRDAVRWQAARGNVTAPDPAVALALEAAATHAEPHAGTVTQEPEARARPVLSVGLFSPDFAGPGSFFVHHELVVESFTHLLNEITALSAKNPKLSFVWRGHQDADWGLHSSLYRRLMAHHGVTTHRTGTSEPQPQVFPDEEVMLTAEMAILEQASEWRMSEVPALELFARLQHHGGPTRLMDVTRNPLIAAWFAVENGIGEDDADGEDTDARLFALATGSVLDTSDQQTSEPVLNGFLADKRYPFWTYDSVAERVKAEWGTGARRRIWVPPAYDARIAAQNAAFLLEGVPILTRETLHQFKKDQKRLEKGQASHWSAADVAASMSIYARPTHPYTRPEPTKARLAPLFTFCIPAVAKRQIRDTLAHTYGYTTAMLYPDIQGISKRLRRSDWLAEKASAEH
jgi:hypothetical protein